MPADRRCRRCRLLHPRTAGAGAYACSILPRDVKALRSLSRCRRTAETGLGARPAPTTVRLSDGHDKPSLAGFKRERQLPPRWHWLLQLGCCCALFRSQLLLVNAAAKILLPVASAVREQFRELKLSTVGALSYTSEDSLVGRAVVAAADTETISNMCPCRHQFPSSVACPTSIPVFYCAVGPRVPDPFVKPFDTAAAGQFSAGSATGSSSCSTPAVAYRRFLIVTVCHAVSLA